MVFAIILIIIVAASILFHYLSPWQATPLASNWGTIDDTIVITLVITGLFFAAIILFMGWAIIKYRHRDGHRAHYEPENRKLEWWLIVLTSVGIAGMLAPGLVVYEKFVHVPEDADIVEVVGQQWQWTFRLPGEDGELGTADIQYMAADNPLGINPVDPKGQDDVVILANELHLPLDRPVKVLLRSKDVLHNFYVPQFRAKMDLVPGTVSYFWFIPTETGTFEILCAELCGVGHYNMRGHVVVDREADYREWLARQQTFAASVNGGTPGGLAAQGQQLAHNQGCLACHSTDGSPGLAPTWKGLFGKTETMEDGSSVTVDDAYLREAILDPGASIVAGYPPVMVDYDFSDEQLDALIAYIKSLDKGEGGAGGPAADSLDTGLQLAQSLGCIACHSTDGSKSIGPTWKGLWGTTETLEDGSRVEVDEAYLRESITDPGTRIVKGYPAVMQPYQLQEEQMVTLISLIEALEE